MRYDSTDPQSTNVETQPPMTSQQVGVPVLPWLQQAILQYLNKSNRHYAPDPMLPQPFGGRLDMGRNLPQGRFNWGQGLR